MKCIVVLTIILSFFLTVSNAAPILEEISDDDDPGEFGSYFEGDMLLSAAQRAAIDAAMSEDADGDTRNGLRDGSKRWPNRTVVYQINDDFDEKQLAMIEDAFADIAKKSCIKFRKKTEEDEHAVTIQGSGIGCFSNVGCNSPGEDMKETRQVMNLAKGCFSHGTIMHEMLHTLGFFHMQTTYNRDDYVTIVWENIKVGHTQNFKKQSSAIVTDFGVSYDYGSVMHYPAGAFSKNGNKTIITKQDGVEIGQRIALSEKDILKLNKMYCEDAAVPKIFTPKTDTGESTTDVISTTPMPQIRLLSFATSTESKYVLNEINRFLQLNSNS